MSIFGIGIDIVEIPRIREAMERQGPRFLDKILTAGERAYCGDGPQAMQRIAARFAAKEAVAKAFGTGIGQRAGLLDIEVVHGASSAPKIVLHGAAHAFALEHGISEVKISLSHAKEYAVAHALAISV